MDVSIIVATFGDNSWINIADNYALHSTKYNFPDIPLVRVHGGSTLAEARNAAADLVRTEWMCFLDADDGLDTDYFDEMSKATGDLRVPRLLFSTYNGWNEPFDLSKRDIDYSNPCPIGTLIKTSMFEDVGGFWEEPAYEDWSLFRRAWLLGATIEHTDARYYAYNLGGRNSSVTEPAGEIEKIRSSHDKWIKELKV